MGRKEKLTAMTQTAMLTAVMAVLAHIAVPMPSQVRHRPLPPHISQMSSAGMGVAVGTAVGTAVGAAVGTAVGRPPITSMEVRLEAT